MNPDIKKQTEALKKKFRETSKKVKTEMDRAIVKCAQKVERDAKKKCTVDTGRLRSSITHRLKHEDATKPVGEVGTNVEYAPHVEFGTSPHEIRPVNAKALAWTAKGQVGQFNKNGGGGTTHRRYYVKSDGTATFNKEDTRQFAQVVHHPGTKPKPYLYPALNENKEYIRKTIADAIKKVAD
ncbi:HK97-gp10 family putative phage morphogenesis protein [Petroclostridium sp. X23]|uniref:HK97-gp10 family putative phage morphogenesis protein n=1 Tax=Petroclostridium sp. X23 TaxID=3045146 RepID=UPI0024AE06F1|nr:HK97-gp10 family putative phage morphogenesis protein [Petroclostridium sp. X23]WHH59165.1 HK97 gp10 family phage protein [Petroclostridium sp. X23]